MVFWNVMRCGAMELRPPFLDVAAQASARHGVAVCKALEMASSMLSRCSWVHCGSGAPMSAPASLRSVPDSALSRSISTIRRSKKPRADLASNLSRPIHHRRDSGDASGGAALPRYLGRNPGDIQARACGLPGRRAQGDCLQRASLRACAFDSIRPTPDRRRDHERCAFAVGASRRRTAAGIRSPTVIVEQLGAVYERVLEHEPSAAGPVILTRARDTRQSSGTFYTPRTVTAAVVRRTLEPLVRNRTTQQILQLRVLDPAMGSGAFLVATCRYLAAAAAERSLIQEGRWHPGEITASEPSQSAPRDRRCVRRRRQSNGCAARPAVTLARNARIRQATHLSRPSPGRRG